MFEKISLSGVDNTGWLHLRKSGIGGIGCWCNLRCEPIQQCNEGL